LTGEKILLALGCVGLIARQLIPQRVVLIDAAGGRLIPQQGRLIERRKIGFTNP
jgi:hypothetical protein